MLSADEDRGWDHFMWRRTTMKRRSPFGVVSASLGIYSKHFVAIMWG